MNGLKLGIRLSTVAEMVGQCEKMADIGSDHALLPIWLLRQKKVQQAIAGELGEGPFRRAQKAAQDSGEALLEVRQGNGLQVLQPGEVDTVVIAGMGGDLIAEILQDAGAKAHSFPCYILQPMKHEAALRKWLDEQGWQIKQERLIQEKEKYYAALEVIPGGPTRKLNDLEILLGPHLLYSQEAEVQAWLHSMQKKYEKIARNVGTSQTATPEEKEGWQKRATDLKALLAQKEMYADKQEFVGRG